MRLVNAAALESSGARRLILLVDELVVYAAHPVEVRVAASARPIPVVPAVRNPCPAQAVGSDTADCRWAPHPMGGAHLAPANRVPGPPGQRVRSELLGRKRKGAPLVDRWNSYRAHLDAHVLGLTFEALVFVTMRSADRDTVDGFEQAISAIPPRPAGATALRRSRLPLARHHPPGLPAFQQLYDDRLATLPGLLRLSSTLVMKNVVENRPLPL
jgi:hypothetical protein